MKQRHGATSLPHALLSNARHYRKTNQLSTAAYSYPNPGLNSLIEGCVSRVKGLQSHLACYGFVLEKNPSNMAGCASDRGIMPSSSLIKGFPHVQMFADLYCFLLLRVWRQKLLYAKVTQIQLVVARRTSCYALGNCTPALLSY